MSNDLLIIQTEQYSECLRIADSIMQKQMEYSAELIEIFSQGTCTHALILGQFSQYRNSDVTIISNVNKKVLNAFLNVDLQKMTDGMVILESESLGALLTSCQHAVEKGASIVDFRWFRGGQKRGHMIYSPHTVQLPVDSKVQVSQFSNLSADIQDLYQPLA